MNEPPLRDAKARTVEKEVEWRLAALCRACGADRAQVVALIGEGVFEPLAEGSSQEHGGAPSLQTARAAMCLIRGRRLNYARAGRVLDLLDEIRALRSSSRRSPTG